MKRFVLALSLALGLAVPAYAAYTTVSVGAHAQPCTKVRLTAYSANSTILGQTTIYNCDGGPVALSSFVAAADVPNVNYVYGSYYNHGTLLESMVEILD